MNFIVVNGYYELNEDVKSRICNGAGAAGDWKSYLIPNTMYGLDCIEAFNIHDYAYYIGITPEDKKQADIAMLLNILEIINEKGGMLAFLRRYRAIKYYDAVHNFGDDAFYTFEKRNLAYKE